MSNRVIVYTDGACSGNPGPGGWGVVLLSVDGFVREMGGFAPNTTNNQMEMIAAIEALEATSTSNEEVALYTDSKYVIQGITAWIHGWKKRGWKKSGGGEILNLDLWKRLYHEVYGKGRKDKVEWCYVPGHAGIPGNERVDKIAVDFSLYQETTLFEGQYKDYSFDLTPPAKEALEKGKKKSSSKKKKKGVYLSYIDGELQRHNEWKSCEMRVKGRSGALYKKCTSDEEIKETLKKWGVSEGA